ncbi:MAG: hypothetical protein LBJ22_02065 [Synergistaceae bacterium]|nr:hypothetical protein [Synergistaceae bacterium]
MRTLEGFDKITCRLAIQVCIGLTPGGRLSHRTFSVKGIRPDADMSALAAFVRDAVAPILAYPITKVRLVTKKVRVLFDFRKEIAPLAAPAPEPEKDPTDKKLRAPFGDLFGLVFSVCEHFQHKTPTRPLGRQVPRSLTGPMRTRGIAFALF